MLPNKTLETISKILIRHYALEISTMIVIDIITYTNTYTQNIHMHRIVNWQKVNWKINFIEAHNLNLDEVKFSLKYIRTNNQELYLIIKNIVTWFHTKNNVILLTMSTK